MMWLLFFLLWSTCQALWSVNQTKVYYDGQPFNIKAASYFGMETCTFAPHGLWVHPLTWYFDFLQLHHFNVIRLPLSEDWLIHGFDTYKPEPWAISADASLQGLFSYQILDRIVNEAYVRNMFVLFDMHRLSCTSQSHELWYSVNSDEYTVDSFFQAWKKIFDRYGDHPAFHGIDLLNEPRGVAEFGLDHSKSWNLFVEQALHTLPEKGLMYVEGVNWGHNLSGIRQYPIRGFEDRIVFSPHTYGPSVVPSASLDLTTMRAEWDEYFGFLVEEQKRCVVIGEFGGRYTNEDRFWQDAFVEYLVGLNITGVYWCLNADSDDTGGLLASDWTTPEWGKLNLVEKLQPSPSVVRW